MVPTLREKRAKDGAPTFVILLAEGWATRPTISSESLARFMVTTDARHFGLAFFGPKEPK